MFGKKPVCVWESYLIMCLSDILIFFYFRLNKILKFKSRDRSTKKRETWTTTREELEKKNNKTLKCNTQLEVFSLARQDTHTKFQGQHNNNSLSNNLSAVNAYIRKNKIIFKRHWICKTAYWDQIEFYYHVSCVEIPQGRIQHTK